MNNKVFESEQFDIVVTKHKDYKDDNYYLVRYGLQVEVVHSLTSALNEFRSCVMHAIDCEGL